VLNFSSQYYSFLVVIALGCVNLSSLQVSASQSCCIFA